MKLTRRSVQIAAAVAMLGAFPVTSAFAQDKPKVALVMKSLANEFFVTMAGRRQGAPEGACRRLRR